MNDVVFARAAAVLALALSHGSAARAQDSTRSLAPVMFVNDEWERYARVLQVSGDVPLYPWSVREFGMSEVVALAPKTNGHPWSGIATHGQRTIKGFSITTLPAQAQTIFNSQFPFGYNDGPVWAGRGATTIFHTGVAAKAGPLSMVLAPMFFRAENSSFALLRQETGTPEPDVYGDWVGDGGIDQPQRFGPHPYERFDPGNSTVRLDLGPAALGFSTANEHWGPARDHPLVLGNNAAGFPHAFVGSSHPVNVWVGKVQARLLWGKLYESAYTYMRRYQPYRFATGFGALFTPRGAPGLELGASRFFHVLWSPHALSSDNLIRSFADIFRARTANRSGDNQLASIFARWVFPEGGLEVYSEYAREDYGYDVRDVFVEPDQEGGYLLGFQRVLGRSSEKRTVIRGEVANTRLSGVNIVREQGRFYTHGAVGQGHTNLGQVLGSFGAFGGGASTLAVDSYSAGGRRTISFSRILRAQKRDNDIHLAIPQEADVMHTLGIDGLRFRGRMAVTYELTAVYELNRNFARDVFNLRAASGIQYVW